MNKHILILLVLLIPLVLAQNESNLTISNGTNCTGDYCVIETDVSTLPSNYNSSCITDCDNFIWINKYIKEQLNNKSLSEDQMTFVSLLMQGNYGLQEDLSHCQNLYVDKNEEYNELNKSFKGQRVMLIISVFITLCVVILNYYLIKKK